MLLYVRACKDNHYCLVSYDKVAFYFSFHFEKYADKSEHPLNSTTFGNCETEVNVKEEDLRSKHLLSPCRGKP